MSSLSPQRVAEIEAEFAELMRAGWPMPSPAARPAAPATPIEAVGVLSVAMLLHLAQRPQLLGATA